jgi:hypothetical protein
METTERLRLPLLVPGQMQKEVTHNEALLLLDGLVHLLVEGDGLLAPPASPAAGQAWIVPPAAEGAWQGRDGRLAIFTSVGWRFVEPLEGMTCWMRSAGTRRRFEQGFWVSELAYEGRPAISDPAGGSVVDVEAREALSALIGWLRAVGLVG